MRVLWKIIFKKFPSENASCLSVMLTLFLQYISLIWNMHASQDFLHSSDFADLLACSGSLTLKNPLRIKSRGSA